MQQVSMKERLEQALKKAVEIAPRARLVSVIGRGLHGDGTVSLGRYMDRNSRWEYAFMDDMEGKAPMRYLTVTYFAPDIPFVDTKAGNVSEKIPFETEVIPLLSDSKVLAEFFNGLPDHKPMGGNDQDVMVYRMEAVGKPVAYLQNWTWQRVRVNPVTLEKCR